ncbi:unnamed protein product [Chrysodeixis includens]|uniref:Major facilitator superfamily (MFS) profile domain-containing protein n=1 Tax=Chrysodeixis includens TaxID=689277 RepID=A0A9P0BQ27_CHRIL|nr:unnamed protein product [Chrysodeixis includens]
MYYIQALGEAFWELLGYGSAAKVDLITKMLGTFGKFHFALLILLCISKFPIAFHQMAIIFLAPKVVYTCEGETNACPCPNPVYDRSIFTDTIVMKWDLICEKKPLISLSQTIFQLGTLIGSVVFGMASDRFGRRKPMIFAIVVQSAFGFLAASIETFWTFNFVRFIVGLSVGGTMVIGFVILMEYTAQQHREIISAIYQVPFNLGHTLIPVFSYFFRDYRHFQMAGSTSTLICLLYFCFLPETARWLIAMKQTERAINVLTTLAKINGRPTANIRTDVLTYQLQAERNKLKKGDITDLFRTPNLRKNILCCSFNWFSCSYCFYGVSQYIGQLSGNAFINVAASAIVALLGTLSSVPLMRSMGRRTILLLCHLISSLCLFFLAILPSKSGDMSIICACAGTVTSFIVFLVVYLYTSELFPTVVRNAAMGFCSMVARIGSMIAPFIIDLQAIKPWLAPVGFALVPLACFFITLKLPETKGCQLTTTIAEGEEFGKKKPKKGEKV